MLRGSAYADYLSQLTDGELLAACRGAAVKFLSAPRGPARDEAYEPVPHLTAECRRRGRPDLMELGIAEAKLERADAARVNAEAARRLAGRGKGTDTTNEGQP